MTNEVEKHMLDPVARELLPEILAQKLNIKVEGIEWTKPPRATRIKPPPTVVAVLVDLTVDQGAIHVSGGDGKYMDMVGTENAGYFVVVPFNCDWTLRRAGAIEIGWVLGKESS